jgi:hypothetical protein
VVPTNSGLRHRVRLRGDKRMRNRSSSNRCERDLPDLHSPFRPGDFPLGSRESRVAARALADHLNASEETMHVIVECIGSPERNRDFFVPLKAR